MLSSGMTSRRYFNVYYCPAVMLDSADMGKIIFKKGLRRHHHLDLSPEEYFEVASSYSFESCNVKLRRVNPNGFVFNIRNGSQNVRGVVTELLYDPFYNSTAIAHVRVPNSIEVVSNGCTKVSFSNVGNVSSAVRGICTKLWISILV